MRHTPPTNAVHPKKLLLTKWTAVQPIAKDKHFLVSAVIEPEVEGGPVQWIELEALFSKQVQRLPWRDLRDATRWRQGWV
jgi:tryptophan-rich hypothetical protein